MIASELQAYKLASCLCSLDFKFRCLVQTIIKWIFDAWDHLVQWNIKKNHLRVKMTEVPWRLPGQATRGKGRVSYKGRRRRCSATCRLARGRHGIFANLIERWSFLTFHSPRWSLVSKIRYISLMCKISTPKTLYSDLHKNDKCVDLRIYIFKSLSFSRFVIFV